VQDHELAGYQRSIAAPRITDDPLTGRAFRRNVPIGWFDPDMVLGRPPTGNRDRRQAFSDEAIQICLPMKVLPWHAAATDDRVRAGPSALGRDMLDRIATDEQIGSVTAPSREIAS
jgi:hypothetical protein